MRAVWFLLFRGSRRWSRLVLHKRTHRVFFIFPFFVFCHLVTHGLAFFLSRTNLLIEIVRLQKMCIKGLEYRGSVKWRISQTTGCVGGTSVDAYLGVYQFIVGLWMLLVS